MPSDRSDDPEHPPRVRRERTRARRVPVSWWIAAIVVVVAGLWAATSIGERPSLEPGTASTDDGSPGSSGTDANGGGNEDPSAGGPDESGTLFSSDAEELPSAGCADRGDSGDVPSTDLTVEGTVVARYTLTAGAPQETAGPGTVEPAPLLVVISEAGLPVAELASESALFEVTPGWIHVGVDPLVPGDLLGGTGMPKLLEDAIATQCVDLDRVFVVGFGEGGGTAGAVACSAPQLVVGVAMVAGWSEPACSPDPRVAIRIVAAGDDPEIDFGTALEQIGSTWADSLDARDEGVDGRNEETIVRTWRGPGGVTVETTATVTGGHGWSVPASLAVKPFLEDTARSLG